MEQLKGGKEQAAARLQKKTLAEQGAGLMAGAATAFPFSETTQAAFVALHCQIDSSGVQLLGRLVALEENEEQLALLANAANIAHGDRVSSIGEIDLALMRETVQHVLSGAIGLTSASPDVLQQIMTDLYPAHMQPGLSLEEAAERERIIRREAERLVLASRPRERSELPPFHRGRIVFSSRDTKTE